MQTAILVIICVQFCVYIYVVLKGASNARRYSKERDEIYRIEKQIGKEYRAELLARVKIIEEKQDLVIEFLECLPKEKNPL